MGNMRFKVGDRVRIKGLDWYNENKDENRQIKFENGIFTTLKSRFLGLIMTIEEITLEKQYILMEDQYKTLWTDEMIEGLVEEEVGLVDNLSSRWVNEFNLPDGYIFKDENGNIINATKIVLEKKKKEYPKTYEECCDVLDIPPYYKLKYLTHEHGYREYTTLNKLCSLQDKLNTLGKLLICRDAYWKIAGEEMGLGKPWEPDWKNDDTHKFVIHVIKDEIRCGVGLVRSDLLSFPTEEMRDAFYENFKELIGPVKELL